jgi:hypothetical protein
MEQTHTRTICKRHKQQIQKRTCEIKNMMICYGYDNEYLH